MILIGNNNAHHRGRLRQAIINSIGIRQRTISGNRILAHPIKMALQSNHTGSMRVRFLV